ncbi:MULTISPECIES: aldehyde dehydrogenase [Streptacidiphilus]|uniref:Aldehyde dehydrogenase n=1 Tax=Streptacidiphilus cavernicola TaxID=3342716 RepID=A0ABV6UJZ3_9ACTN|nr:aldehyde dehydrogenase family protein [Streptacidiphilus jeojiense]
MSITEARPHLRTVRPGQLFIDGAWADAAEGRTIPNLNPADGTVTTQVAAADPADMQRAVRSARRAFDEGPWPRMSAHERGRVLLRAAELIERDAQEIAFLETIDMGKPISVSSGIDLPFVTQAYRYFGGLAAHLDGATRSTGTPTFAYTLHEPVGVVGAITPFNFPLILSTSKLAPALAAGNTVVHKPAEPTPLTALKMAALLAEAGLPEGVLNVVTGPGPELGQTLVDDPGVDKIAFTGSTAVGQSIIRAAAATLKKVTMELGGKSANILFADADLDRAVDDAFWAAFFNTGQYCMAGTRLLVQRSVLAEVTERLVAQAEAVTPADPLLDTTWFGPIAHQAQYDKVVEYVGIGQAEGARLATGGTAFHNPDQPDGLYWRPTIFTDATPDMRISQEEIFGPVLTVLPFDTEQEAVALANSTKYGLAAGVHTRDAKRAHRVAGALAAGTCWVNTYSQFDPRMPMGGYKHSGYGREFGPESMHNYTQVKSVWMDLRE